MKQDGIDLTDYQATQIQEYLFLLAEIEFEHLQSLKQKGIYQENAKAGK
jgi:hypothetical protein